MDEGRAKYRCANGGRFKGACINVGHKVMGIIMIKVKQGAQQYLVNHLNMVEAKVDERTLPGTKAEFAFMENFGIQSRDKGCCREVCVDRGSARGISAINKGASYKQVFGGWWVFFGSSYGKLLVGAFRSIMMPFI